LTRRLQLEGTKSTLRKDYSILNYLLIWMRDQRPDLLNWFEDLEHLRFCR
jgi:hypothetical protein